MKTLQVVSGIIENSRGEVLLAQRPPGKLLAGAWEFPGGKIEPGEDPVSALVRELQEELQLQIRVRKFLGKFPHNYDWGQIVLHVYAVEALNVPQATEQVHFFEWMPAAAIDPAILAAADISPLESYLQDLGHAKI